MKICEADIRDAFFDEIYEIAARDKNVIFITADADSFSLRKYKHDFPEQFINIGVAEQNMVAVAAGLALTGKKVFILALIPFITLRCFEHIKVNICSMNLPVTIIGLGAGFASGIDGPTHHGTHDIAVMRILPEITIFNPSDSALAVACAKMAYKINSPVYVRLDKGKYPELYCDRDDYEKGFKVLMGIRDINIISTGFMTKEAMKIAVELKRHSIDIGLVDLYRIKPIDTGLLLKTLGNAKKVITLEENSIAGGIGTVLSEIFKDNNAGINLKRMALPDINCFAYGTREWLIEYYGLGVKDVVELILKEDKNV